MQREDPIVSDFTQQLCAPLTVSEFVRQLHSNDDSERHGENEDLNLGPSGKYREANEVGLRSASPPPKPIEYWDNLAQEAEHSMVALRFKYPPSFALPEGNVHNSSSSASSSDGSENPVVRSGGGAITSTCADSFPISEAIPQQVDPGTTGEYLFQINSRVPNTDSASVSVASVIVSAAAIACSRNVHPVQSTACSADPHLQDHQRSEGKWNRLPAPPMFRAVTETSWARLERQNALLLGADGHTLSGNGTNKRHHGRHKSNDERRNKHTKHLPRPSTSSINEAIEQPRRSTGSRWQHLRHRHSRTIVESSEHVRHCGLDSNRHLDSNNTHTALPSSGDCRPRSEVGLAYSSRQMKSDYSDSRTAFKDRNNILAYYSDATHEWPAHPAEGPSDVAALEQPDFRRAFGKLKGFSEKLAKRFKEANCTRTELSGAGGRAWVRLREDQQDWRSSPEMPRSPSGSVSAE
ncbi:hypothetical protein DFP73DRAFT_598268 [Morchella snyderi]|nr:hypothetical protein DFP73DRAFT_598268 [Morchella snyderi]